MFGHETRPYHFFVPAALVILGGVFLRLETWEYVGIGLWVIAGAATYFLVYTARMDKKLNEIREHYQHEAEMTKIDHGKKVTKVIVDKTPLNGYMQQSFNELSIPPGKLLQFARGVLIEGRPLTIREWTPLKRGKLFSDPQWRTLIQFMKHPDWDDKRIKFVVPINPNNENDGHELTAAGRKWLEDVIETEVEVIATQAARL